MPDAPLSIPQNSIHGTIGGLHTPDSVVYVQSWGVGRIGETGERVFKHEFMLTYKGETEMFGVISEESASDAQVEDMAAWVSERSIAKIIERLQARGSKLLPEDLANRQNWRVRRELAAIWRDMRRQAKKRRESSTGKIYWPGSTI